MPGWRTWPIDSRIRAPVVRQKAIRQLAFAEAEAVPALTTVLRESDSRVQRRNAVCVAHQDGGGGGAGSGADRIGPRR